MLCHDGEHHRVKEAIAARADWHVEGMAHLKQRADDGRRVLLHAQEGIASGRLDPSPCNANGHDVLASVAWKRLIGQGAYPLFLTHDSVRFDTQCSLKVGMQQPVDTSANQPG